MSNVKMKGIDWVLSLLIPFLLLLIIWKICGINFETNDDTMVMMSVTGAKTGLPTAETIFSNILWGALLSFLYGISENIPWYMCIYLVLSWISLAILFLSCIRFSMNYDDKQRYSKDSILTYMSGGAIFFILFFSVFAYYSVLLQFTTVAALCGLGAIILFVLFPEGNRYSYILFVILLFFADTIRPKVGYMVTAAFALTATALYLLYKQINKIYVFMAFIMQAVTYATNALYEKINNWTAFREYHRARAYWTDYAHPSFKENSALYESVGWTEQLYKLADKWFFMDRRINAESFESLNTEIDATSSFDWNVLKSFCLSSQLRMTFFVIAFFIIVSIFVCVYKREYKRVAAMAAGCLTTIGIILYFIYSGRLPYRVSFSVIVLFILPVLLLTVRGVVDILRKKWFNAVTCIAGAIVVMYSIFGNYGLVRTAYLASIAREKITQIKKDVEQYAIDHPDNIYIYDLSLAIAGDPFTTYSDGKPYNLVFWGGSGMYSPPYYDQLAVNGLDELYSDCFLDENVFFMGREEPDADLIMYMKDEFSENLSVEVVYENDGFTVYRFNN